MKGNCRSYEKEAKDLHNKKLTPDLQLEVETLEVGRNKIKEKKIALINLNIKLRDPLECQIRVTWPGSIL